HHLSGRARAQPRLHGGRKGAVRPPAGRRGPRRRAPRRATVGAESVQVVWLGSWANERLRGRAVGRDRGGKRRALPVPPTSFSGAAFSASSTGSAWTRPPARSFSSGPA